MFGTDLGVIERYGLFRRERYDFLDPWRVRKLSINLLIRAEADLHFDLLANGFEIEPQPLQDVDCQALPQGEETEEQMFGADKIVLEVNS